MEQRRRFAYVPAAWMKTLQLTYGCSLSTSLFTDFWECE
jgi:hypothetical protein